MKHLVLIIFLMACARHAAAGMALITGKPGSLKDGDSVSVLIIRYGDPDFNGYRDAYSAPVKGGMFRIEIPAGNLPLRIVLFRFGFGNPGKIVPGFYLLAGDQVAVSRDSGHLSFSGRGAERWKVQQQLADIYRDLTANITWGNVGDTRQYFRDMDATLAEGMAYVNANKAILGKAVYHLLVSEMAGQYLGKPGFVQFMRPGQQALALQAVRDSIISLPDDIKAILADNNPVMVYADRYAIGLSTKYWFDSCALTGRAFDVAAYYRYINTHYTGWLRERLVVNLLYKEREGPLDLGPLLDEAMGWVKESTFRNILASMRKGRVRGVPAFNFSLPGADGKQYSQRDFLGKVVLLDFYYTGCGSCRAAHIYIDSIEKLLGDTSFRVVCISEDTDKYWFVKGTKTGKYSSPTSVCLYTGGVGIDHPIFRYYSVSAFPTLILIDKKGKLMENPAYPVDDKGESLLALVRQGLGK